MEEKITLQTDTGEAVDFYVLEETRINGMNYLLVTDSEEEEDGECYILKDVSKAEDRAGRRHRCRRCRYLLS